MEMKKSCVEPRRIFLEMNLAGVDRSRDKQTFTSFDLNSKLRIKAELLITLGRSSEASWK